MRFLDSRHCPAGADKVSGASVLLLAVAIGLVPVFVVASAFVFGRTTQSMRQTATFVKDQQYAKAMRLLEGMTNSIRSQPLSQLLEAKAIAGLGDNEKSLEIYRQVKLTDQDIALWASYGIGSKLLSLGQMQKAEPHLREALRLNPHHKPSLRLLSRTLQLQGRIWEAQYFVWQLIAHADFRGDDLYMIGTTQEFLVDESRINRCRILAPSDPLPLLAHARRMLMQNRVAESEKLLRQIIASAPDITEAQVAIGRIHLDRGDDGKFLDWHNQLAAHHDTHPDVWLLRGIWLSKSENHSHASRCFIEAIERFSNHVEATYQLSQSLARLGKRSLAEAAGDRARAIAQFEISISEFRGNSSLPVMQKLASQLADLDRYWEAAAVCHIANQAISGKALWASGDLKKYVRSLSRDRAIAIDDRRPAALPGIERDNYPLPSKSFFARQQRRQVSVNDSTDIPSNRVQFFENARDAGFEFTFYNGSETAKGLEHIFETTGGGIAVIDFDADLFPDIWAAQGSGIWEESQKRTDVDQLFRNIDGQRFENSTQPSEVHDDLFSQGVAAGDVNNDGFADAFVANQGSNRLYLNNGDGTFTDITKPSGLTGKVWSMGAAIVDLNQDSIPDIYEVNYLEIDSVLNRRCKSNGEPLTCAPTLFTAEQDRLWLGNGDGTFSDHSESSGIVQPEGKGLGLIAADFDGSGQISVFVGNDTTNNFFFRNATAPHGAMPAFEEQGLVSGLATDGEGRAQATMGIAFGDANSDGLFDIFTTNFYADPNSLLLQQSNAYFVDRSRDSGVYDAGYNLLGFGSQFLDADLDGRPDLLVTNGHVDRSSATGEPDEMPPQFFHNLGGGKFMEPAPKETGAFFSQKHLGRSLVTLDWNRDGLQDAAISHLYSPAALLTNSTVVDSKSLTVSLVGHAGSRDANGTIVSIDQGNGWPTQTKQLYAGNGYLSSNERTLIFGLHPDTQDVRLSVKWPDNSTADYKVTNRSGRIRITNTSTNGPITLPH
jgi:tetratricopeptide (TPR) repeat protein